MRGSARDPAGLGTTAGLRARLKGLVMGRTAVLVAKGMTPLVLRTARRREPVRSAARFLLVAALALLTAGAAAGVAAATQTSSQEPLPVNVTGAGAGARAYTLGEDWTHVRQVVANLRAAPPAEPLVVLLGGSIAREITESDATWAVQIEAAGGPRTAAYNLSSRNRTLACNIAIVKALPRVPAVVLIGVSLGSFTSPHRSAAIHLPAPTATLPPYIQHPYTRASILPDAEKARLVTGWLRMRYPVYQRNFGPCARLLSRLVRVCKDRGFTPALVEMPLNLAVIGHRFDTPVGRLRGACRRIAERQEVPFVRSVARARLVSRDFADLWHLVETGRAITQPVLSTESVALLTAPR
jgi:hypothetical protein